MHLGSTDCIQLDHVAHVKVWAMAAHTSTHSSIFSSPPLTYTPHTYPRIWLYVLTLPLLVTVVYLFNSFLAWPTHPTWHSWWWPGISCHHDHLHLHLALDHGLQGVRIGDGMAIYHPHDLNME